MTDPVTAALELLRLLAREGRRRILALSITFSVIALAVLAAGALLPKQYEAYAILLAESRNMIAPLMAGRAVQPGVTDDAQIVRQAFLSRRILREIHAAGGFGEIKDPVVEVRELDRLAKRITIQSRGRELIRLAYRDTDPRRCFELTSKLAEIYIREATVGNERESRDAFEFIDKQVREYAVKVEQEHSKVLAYKRGEKGEGSAAARRGAGAPPGRRSPEQIAALAVEESSLAAELASSEARRTRRLERIAVLERELDNLLTSLTENHPNVQRAREELRVQRAEADRVGAGEEATIKSLRTRHEKVRAQLSAASGTPVVAIPGMIPGLMQPYDVDPEMRGVGLDSTLSELVRRYEASRQIYQDLLVRRENARVSMELETERGGIAVRVYEKPELPVVPTGLRLMHFSLIGLVLGAAVPVGLLFALLRLDPRVRSARQLEHVAHVPLLVGIPHTPTPVERGRQRRDTWLASGIVLLVFAAYVGLFIVRSRAA